MAYIETVREPGAGAVADLFEEDRQNSGYVPNFTRTFAVRPDVYRAWKQLNGAVKASMDLGRYELVTVAAAVALRSSYCSLAHGRILAEKYLSPADVVRLATDPSGAHLAPVDRAVVQFARKVVLEADQVTEADVEGLRAHGLTDEEILDVVLAATARCFFSKTLDATGTPADAVYAQMDEVLRATLTVGRPMAGLAEPGA